MIKSWPKQASLTGCQILPAGVLPCNYSRIFPSLQLHISRRDIAVGVASRMMAEESEFNSQKEQKIFFFAFHSLETYSGVYPTYPTCPEDYFLVFITWNVIKHMDITLVQCVEELKWQNFCCFGKGWLKGKFRGQTHIDPAGKLNVRKGGCCLKRWHC